LNAIGSTSNNQLISNFNAPTQFTVWGDNYNYAKQGNHNTAETTIVQVNEAEQTQRNEQFQLLNQRAL
jgi:hypothetical protein